MALTIATFNANGLRDIDKVRQVFGLFKSLHLDIICIQETFWDDNFINDYIKNLWDGTISYSNCGDKHRAGVATLISKQVDIAWSLSIQSDSGRLLKLVLNTTDQEINLFNVYAYNVSKNRIEFFSELETLIDTNKNNIIVGDFNVAPDPYRDRRGGMHEDDKQSIRSFQSLMHASRSVDIWRYKNPNRIGYTRKQIVNNQLKQSRIDHMLVSRSLLVNTQSSYIRCTSFSDHEVLITKFNLNPVEYGPGLWIMNNHYLSEPDYQEQIKQLLIDKSHCHLKRESPLIWWDNLKYFIKKLSVKYAKDKSHERNRDFFNIQRKLETEYRKPDRQQNIDLIRELQLELSNIERHQCRGAIIRSKAFWAVESDKCTKYFLGLEKHRQESKVIKELVDEDGEIVSNTDSFLNIQEKFYEKLYKHEKNDVEKENILLSHIDRKLSDESKENLERGLSCEELRYAIEKMQNNKSPGPDGITAEFYKMFWPELSTILLELYQTISEFHVMSKSMCRGIITLIYKNKGDRRHLKNWRPISLLNVDYKIIAKVMANRMKGVLHTIISEDQTCCIPGRDIAENIMSLRDVVDFIESEETSQGIILKIDQEKAFDRVSHTYMFNVLKAFNFGDNFINWIQTFYTNISSAVKCNGFLTPYFNIERSVRQGCPLSALLYTICAQPLNSMIHSNSNIKGIGIPDSDKQSIIYQHADDSTFTLYDEKSCDIVMECLDIYCAASGAKINCYKTEVMFLGTYKHNPPQISFPFTLASETIQILGVYVGPNAKRCTEQNWSNKVEKIKRTIHLWKARHLSLEGKVTVISSLLVSQMWYTLNVTHIPLKVERDIHKEIIGFLWDKKPPKVGFYTLIGNKEDGGLKLPDIMLKKAALRIKWVKRLFDENNNSTWKSTMKYFLSKYGNFKLGDRIFQLVQFDTKLMTMVPEFYKELLLAWAYVNNNQRLHPTNKNEVLSQPLFANNQIVSDGKMFHFPEFTKSGIVCIEDIFYDFLPGFYSEKTIVKHIHENNPRMADEKIEEKYKIILNSIPKRWKDILLTNQKDDSKVVPQMWDTDTGISVEMLSTRFIYNCIVKRIFKSPISLRYWNDTFENFDSKKVGKAIHLSVKDPTSAELDFKIFHRILYTNEFLLKIRMVDSELCCVCKRESEDLLHMMLKCSILEEFMKYIKDIISDILKLPIYHTQYDFEQVLMFGIQKNLIEVNTTFLNFLLSIVRLSIYKRRCFAVKSGNILDIKRFFIKQLNNSLQYQWTYYMMKRKRDIFVRKFAKNVSFITVTDNSFNVDL